MTSEWFKTGYTLLNVAARMKDRDIDALKGKLEREMGGLIRVDPDTGAISTTPEHIGHVNRHIESLFIRDALAHPGTRSQLDDAGKAPPIWNLLEIRRLLDTVIAEWNSGLERGGNTRLSDAGATYYNIHTAQILINQLLDQSKEESL